MTAHPLLEELDDDQDELVRLLGRPWTIPDLSDQRGWPVWDFVARAYRRSHPDRAADDVLATLPSIVVDGRSYGLWWGSDHRGLFLQGGERVGLTIAGLHHLRPFLADVIGGLDPLEACLSIVRDAARREVELDASDDWTQVVSATLDLRTETFGRAPGPLAPVQLIGQVLMREFIPLATETSQFNYSIELGRGKLAPFRDVQTVDDYVEVAESLAERSAPEQAITGSSYLRWGALLESSSDEEHS